MITLTGQFFPHTNCYSLHFRRRVSSSSSSSSNHQNDLVLNYKILYSIRLENSQDSLSPNIINIECKVFDKLFSPLILILDMIEPLKLFNQREMANIIGRSIIRRQHLSLYAIPAMDSLTTPGSAYCRVHRISAKKKNRMCMRYFLLYIHQPERSRGSTIPDDKFNRSKNPRRNNDDYNLPQLDLSTYSLLSFLSCRQWLDIHLTINQQTEFIEPTQ